MDENELYFKDSFSQSEGNINISVNNLTAACISSSNNKFSLDSDGNLIVNTIQTTGSTSIGYDIDKVYPIGSIYMSVNGTNPSTLFGGTWEQIKDKFLLCSGDVYANASTGGSASVSLTTNNLPSHTHAGTTSSDGLHTHTGTINSAGEHKHNTQGQWRLALNTSATNRALSYNQQTGDPIREDNPILSAGSHVHTFTINSNGSHYHSFTTNSTGEGTAFNNMPPYLAVYVWKRVS